MCGIAGWINFREELSDKTEILKNMTARLAHRGPDASGEWLSRHAALGHKRLAVVDPEGGEQPMLRRRGDDVFVLVYNGELYNTEELRLELRDGGATFRGWSDTEVLLEAYMAWGEDCLPKLNGIFAFAVWDSQKNSLFLARDRIGVKPLFYSLRGASFLFASEIKALLAHPLVRPDVDETGLAEIFSMGPGRTPGCGVFSDISELRPGWCMRFDAGGLRTRQYWALRSHAHEDGLDETVEKVRALVCDSVERQLVSDVPLCVLLSGGLDSSVVASIAARAYRAEGKEPVATFSVDYVGNDRFFQKNEFQPDADAPWTRRVSDYLGTRQAACLIDTPELAEALFSAVRARDLPGMTDVDASLLLFSRWIKERATVGLSGECADEVFGGYPWFYRQPEGDAETFPWTRRIAERTKLYSPALLARIDPEDYARGRYLEALEEVPAHAGDGPGEARMRALFYLNLTRWMPVLLDRKDRMSMASGLELRVPFCDHRLVEYVWNVPWEMKHLKDREKGLLRQAMTGMLPEDALWRKKSPYPKTHNPAYLDALRKMTLALLDDASSPLLPFLNREALWDLAETATPATHIPWFGQLMNTPQLLAYFIQTDFWLREYKVNIV